MATLGELEARFQRLTDIREIERLQKIYGYYCDYFELNKVVDLFSDNAESVETADHGDTRARKFTEILYRPHSGRRGQRTKIRSSVNKLPASGSNYR